MDEMEEVDEEAQVAEVVKEERVKVQMVFGPTLPYLPVAVEVPVTMTWQEVLNECNIKVDSCTELIVLAPFIHLKSIKYYPPLAFLDDRVSVLQGKTKTLKELRVHRNGGFKGVYSNDFVEMTNKPNWREVYDTRLIEISDASLLGGFSHAYFNYVEITRNLNHKGGMLSLVPEFDRGLKLQIRFKKKLLDLIGIMVKWGTGTLRFKPSIFEDRVTIQKVLRRVHYYCSKIKERPLISAKVFLALKRALAAAEMKGFTDKMGQLDISSDCEKTDEGGDPHPPRFLTKGGDDVAIGSCRLLLSLLPHLCARILHVMVYCIKQVVESERFISAAGLSKNEFIASFMPYILGVDWELTCEKEAALKIVSFLVDCEEELFRFHKEIDALQRIAKRHACAMPMEKKPVEFKIPEQNSASATSTKMPSPFGIGVQKEVASSSNEQRQSFHTGPEIMGTSKDSLCRKFSIPEVEQQKTAATLEAKEKVFQLCRQAAIDEKCRKGKLEAFKKRYPDVFEAQDGNTAIQEVKQRIQENKLKRRNEQMENLMKRFDQFGTIFSPKRKKT